MKIVTFTDIADKIRQETVSDPQIFIRNLRLSAPKFGYKYRVLNISEENGVELRDTMNKTLIADGVGLSKEFVCIKDYVEDIIKQYGELKMPLGIDFDKKEMCLVPPFEEFMNALRTLANKATGRTVSDEEIYAAYDISEEDYYNVDSLIDYEEMYRTIVENLVDEPDYSVEGAKYEQASNATGWNYSNETVIESVSAYLDNYDDLVERWQDICFNELRKNLSDFTVVGPLGTDFILSERIDLWEEITEKYPLPSKEYIEENMLTGNESEYEY